MNYAINICYCICAEPLLIYLAMTNVFEKMKPVDLAKCIGVTPSFASQIRTGHRKLPIKYIKIVSEEFNIPPRELRPDLFSILGE